MVERVTLTDEQKKLIAKTKPLIQKLNTEVHTDNEIRLPFFTDNGFNTHFGKNIFINTGVTFLTLAVFILKTMF